MSTRLEQTSTEMVDAHAALCAPDVLDAAIARANDVRDHLKFGSLAYFDLTGAMSLAIWIQGYTSERHRVADPVTRETVAQALSYQIDMAARMSS